MPHCDMKTVPQNILFLSFLGLLLVFWDQKTLFWYNFASARTKHLLTCPDFESRLRDAEKPITNNGVTSQMFGRGIHLLTDAEKNKKKTHKTFTKRSLSCYIFFTEGKFSLSLSLSVLNEKQKLIISQRLSDPSLLCPQSSFTLFSFVVLGKTFIRRELFTIRFS